MAQGMTADGDVHEGEKEALGDGSTALGGWSQDGDLGRGS